LIVSADYTFTFIFAPDCANAIFTQQTPILAMTTPLTFPVTQDVTLNTYDI